MTDRHRIARLPQIALHQLPGPIDRALERPLDQEPRADLTHEIIKDRLAAPIAEIGGHLAQPQRLNRWVSSQLLADPVLERIELRGARRP
jgi:hypothetical protein